MKKLVIFTYYTFIFSNLVAQEDSRFNQYYENILYFNPAYAGSRGTLHITTMHRKQWFGMKGAPMSYTFLIHSPLNYESVGVGFSLVTNKFGLLKQTCLNSDFSYIFKLKKKRKLSVGIKAGLNMVNLNLNEINTFHDNDPALQTQFVNSIQPAIGLGLFYWKENFYCGFSVPNIIQNFKQFTVMSSINQRNYYLLVGGVHKPSGDIILRPCAMLKLNSASQFRLDISNAIIYCNKFWLVCNYTFFTSAGVTVQFNLNTQIKIGYSYEFPTLKIVNFNYGFHEIMLCCDFAFKRKLGISPRYF